MKPLGLLFGTPRRRLVTVLGSNLLFFGGGLLTHHYIDHTARSPGLTIFLVALWMGVGVLTALLTVTGLGERLFYRGYTQDLLRDKMADLDARIEGREPRLDDDDDLEALGGRQDAGSRFVIYFILMAAGLLLLSNQLSGSFLQRYTHPGVAVIHLRSAESAERRRGLEMLVERLGFKVTEPIRVVIGQALEDPDEGVVAKAAAAVGSLGIDELAPKLADLVRERPALAYAALIALAHLGHRGPQNAPASRAQLAELAVLPAAQAEPVALSYALGMLRIPAIPTLLGFLKGAQADPELRFAVIWALGRLQDAQLLPQMSQALRDDDLAVRCAAVLALEQMVVFEASPPLRAAFEASTDPLLSCPERTLPVQVEIRPQLMPYRNYELSVIRALATTDDPVLLTWLVKHQEGREYVTHKLMEKVWERLKEKDQRGDLQMLRQRVRLQRILQAGDAGVGEAGVDAEAGEASDAGAAPEGAQEAPAEERAE